MNREDLPEAEAEAMRIDSSASPRLGADLGGPADCAKGFVRLLPKAANQTFEERRQLERLKVLPGIQVIVPRIIDDPELAVRLGVRLRAYLVQFPALERRRHRRTDAPCRVLVSEAR